MIGLISCSSQKLDRRAPARELYCSPLFKLSLLYALARCTHTFVVSAKHGLVDLDHELDPYDANLGWLSINERRAWGTRTIEQLEDRLSIARGERFEILLLAGEAYARALQWPRAIRVKRFVQPLLGMGIGERLRFLRDATAVAA